MSAEEGKYNIKAISKMLGIQPGTLRAWERRYKMIEPVRNEAGHRLYTEQHLKILKWLIEKVNGGFTISQAVSLLEHSETEKGRNLPMETGDYGDDILSELLKALLSFDEHRAHEILNRAFSLYTIDKVMGDILGRLLVKIGDLWESGEITSAHEHFSSSIIRARISMVLHSLPVNGYYPKVVAVCGPNEWHELGLLIFTLFLRKKGFEVIYIGSSVAEGDLEVVLDEIKPEFIFISCTLEANLPKTLMMVDELGQRYPKLNIGLGGPAFAGSSNRELTDYKEMLVGEAREEWEKWIKRKLKNFMPYS